jgi:hypothetical protein
MLDALGAPSSHFVDALSEVDEDWRTLGHDAVGWIETALLFQRARERPVPAGDGAETPFRYSYSTQQRHTLVPLEAFFAHCRGDRYSADIASHTVGPNVSVGIPSTHGAQPSWSRASVRPALWGSVPVGRL